MSRYPFIVIVTFLFGAELYSQSLYYSVKPAPFTSMVYDEFSPVFYQGGIVFCSNQMDNSLVSYNDGQNKLFKIFYVMTTKGTGWKAPKILANEITTGFNDGPVTFNEDENVIYYSRNNSIRNLFRNISDPSNKLGIFSAEMKDGIWTNIEPFTYNNPLYSYVTPSLSPDGNRIYFSSDIPGGSGGMDLYYCDKRNNEWDPPVNLGPLINTAKNESFPFACQYGKLFFASDGHEGFGGKDLYYSQENNGEWIAPVHLDSAINSTADDFGLVTDSTLENGYFSTNRRKTDDIFSFSAPPAEFPICDTLRENNYCFTFYDEHYQPSDTVPVIYKWKFGNDIMLIGKEVKYCFPGPGDYLVLLSIFDELTGEIIANQVTYNVDLENIEQAYIISNNYDYVGKSISFEGITKDLKGFDRAEYFWDFGAGFKAGGAVMNTTFQKKGEYMVKMGLKAGRDSLGVNPKICVMKKIIIN